MGIHITLGMNKLDPAKRVQILNMLAHAGKGRGGRVWISPALPPGKNTHKQKYID